MRFLQQPPLGPLPGNLGPAITFILLSPHSLPSGMRSLLSTFIGCFLLCKSVENVMHPKPANEIKENFLNSLAEILGLNHLFRCRGPQPSREGTQEGPRVALLAWTPHPGERVTLLLGAPQPFSPGSRLSGVGMGGGESLTARPALGLPWDTVKYLPTSRPGFHPVIRQSPGCD